MKTLLHAPAKINLSLRVLGKRAADGYHDIDSIFLPIKEPADILELERLSTPQCMVECTNPALSGDGNILCKAWQVFSAATGIRTGVRCMLRKFIPLGSGLGGGSSDAAMLLRWLASRHDIPTSDLARIAAATGADVPFFLVNAPARVTGIGDQVSPIDESPIHGTLLLICPPLHVDTRWAYAELDRHRAAGISLTNARPSATEKRLSTGGATPFQVKNDFEAPVFRAYPQLAALKTKLGQLGARWAGMSGSGSSLFGIFETLADAQNARERLAGEQLTIYLCEI